MYGAPHQVIASLSSLPLFATSTILLVLNPLTCFVKLAHRVSVLSPSLSLSLALSLTLFSPPPFPRAC